MFKFLIVCCFILPSFCVAQRIDRVEGTIRDSIGRPIDGIMLRLFNDADTFYALSESYGHYHFSLVKSGRYQLEAEHKDSIFYAEIHAISAASNAVFRLPPIVLKLWPMLLEEIIVRPTPVTVKEDTIQYNASAFLVREGAPVEELIRKFPGVIVDRDGTITAHGRRIQKVRVNGKDFFGGDVVTAIQNLPADIVSNIQIVDDYGEKANLSGVKTGEPQKIININIPPNKKRGSFGTLHIGAGTEGRYLANMFMNHFKEDRQISLLATANNTNQNASAFGGSGRTNTSQAGNAGITTSYNLGLNYRNSPNKKLIEYGSYSYSARETFTEGQTYQQDLNPQSIRITSRANTHSLTTNSHQLNWNMEYSMSPSSFFKLSSNVSHANSKNSGNAVSTINRSFFSTGNRNSSNGLGSNSSLSATAEVNHKFRKNGRDLHVTGTVQFGQADQHNRIVNLLSDVDSTDIDSLFQVPTVKNKEEHQRQELNSSRLNSGLQLSFNEPISKQIFAELSYSLNYEYAINQREVRDLDSISGFEFINPGQSNDYRSTFLTSRYGLIIHSRKKKYNFLVGIMAQPSELKGMNQTLHQETNFSSINWAPTARVMYRFGNSQTLSASYNGNYREPDFMKLQPVVDSTNPSNVIVGNPDLRPEFTNRLSATFNAFTRESGSSLFANFSFAKTINRIVNKIHNDPRSTSRITTYINDDGYYHLSGNITYSSPINTQKCLASAGIRGNFDNNVSYTDNQRSNGQNWVIEPHAKLMIDLPEILNAEIHATYNITKTNARYPSVTIATETSSLTLNVTGRMFLTRTLNLGYDYSKSLNYGYAGSANFNPDILSLFLEYRFLRERKATVRIQGFDLLNQNTGITRTVSGTTITDDRKNGLQRYMLLSFGWRLSNFGS